MEQLTIEYRIRINKGDRMITIDVELSELEFTDLPMILINRGYLKCWCNDNEFDILDRKIISTAA